MRVVKNAFCRNLICYVRGRFKMNILKQLPSLFLLAAVAIILPATSFAKLPVPPGIHPPPGEYDGKHVQQPIEFPHFRHVRDMKINCMYCHTYARRSKVAGIPPTSKCMGCHKVIATDKPRIKLLTKYWKEGKSPVWKKVHDVPDFVHFSHEKHIRRFVFKANFPVEKVQEVCGICHGEIRQMTTARKVKPLNMGFCRRCHALNGGPGDCWKCHK